MEEPTEKKDQTIEGGLDYCFCAKFLIGVPVVFIVSYFAAEQFETPLLQVWAGALAGIATIYIAMKIEKLPSLSGKIVDKK